MSLRARLTLWNVAVLAVLLLLMGAALRARVYARLEAGVDGELARRGRFFPNNWASLPPRRGWPSAPIYGSNGRALRGDQFASDPEGVRLAIAEKNLIFRTVQDRRVYTRWVRTEEGDAAYQTSESLEPVQAAVNQLTGELLALLPFGLLAAGFGALFLTQRALRPIESFRQAAASIQANDLSRRLTVHGRDELARLATTFNEMLARLETAFERQRQFVADASHELKTPLTTIKAAAEIGCADGSSPERSRHLFSRIGEATERTIGLVQSLLILARSDAGALVANRSAVPVEELFEAVAQEAHLLHPEGAHLVFEPQAESLSADPELLFQLLLNLTDNALRHTPKGGTITIRATPTGLTVTDTGTGIAPEHLPHLTERFYRVDSARARTDGGTGLGLAICKSIAEAHGGTLELQSTLGQGTRVSLVLP